MSTLAPLSTPAFDLPGVSPDTAAAAGGEFTTVLLLLLVAAALVTVGRAAVSTYLLVIRPALAFIRALLVAAVFLVLVAIGLLHDSCAASSDSRVAPTPTTPPPTTRPAARAAPGATPGPGTAQPAQEADRCGR